MQFLKQKPKQKNNMEKRCPSENKDETNNTRKHETSTAQHLCTMTERALLGSQFSVWWRCLSVCVFKVLTFVG